MKAEFITSMDGLRGYLRQRGLDPAMILPGGADREPPFSMLATSYYLDLIDWTNPLDPLRRMVIPDALEQNVQSYERADPIGDRAHEPVPGIIHRYPDRCLLMLTPACAVHCRFCFRRNLLGSHRVNAESAMRYIRDHEGLREVIFSGGDPFMLPRDQLTAVVQSLADIPHVRVIRFHTRAPVVSPESVDESLLQALARAPRLVVVLHVNHPREITGDFIRAANRLRGTPAMLLSQSVLLRGVNDRADVLKPLFLGLVEAGIAPYYLHHLDPAAGTHHFRVSLEEGRSLYSSVRAQLPGYTIPGYVIDVPGAGKIPVMEYSPMRFDPDERAGVVDTGMKS